MEFSLSYRVLCKSTIYHYYYLNKASQEFSSMSPDDQAKQLSKYDVASFFDIIPTEKCYQTLRNNNLIFKKQTDGFCVLTLLDANDITKSFYSLADISLSFLLVQKNPYFHNATALPLSDNNNHIYYFNNRAGLNGSVFPNLALNYPVYITGNDYEMGNLVTFNGNLYEAIETMVNSSINPDQPNSGWQLINDEGYVSINDRVPLYRHYVPFTLPSAGIAVTVQLTDISGNIVLTTTDNSNNGILERKLDFQKIPSGRYSMVVTNNADSSVILTRELYLLNEMYTSNVFGIIEISGDTSLGNYSLTDNSRNLNSPVFRLSYKNRSTVWRYINTVDRAVLLESGPNPNTHLGFVSVILNGNELPNPNINSIKPETDKIVSEIFINT